MFLSAHFIVSPIYVNFMLFVDCFKRASFVCLIEGHAFGILAPPLSLRTVIFGFFICFSYETVILSKETMSYLT